MSTTPAVWKAIQHDISDWSKDELVDLIRDLYEASSANRYLLRAQIGTHLSTECEPKSHDSRSEPFFDVLDKALDHLAEDTPVSAPLLRTHSIKEVREKVGREFKDGLDGRVLAGRPSVLKKSI